MSTKTLASALKVGDIVDFENLPGFEKRAYAFGLVDDTAPPDEELNPEDPESDGKMYVTFDKWGEFPFDPTYEFDVLTAEEAETKLTDLYKVLHDFPRDGWSVESDAKYGRTVSYPLSIEWAHEYGEPGYTDPARAILFGNWNYVSKQACDWLESQGFELEWEDEWRVLDDGKAYRTSPTSYGWTQSFVTDDEGNDYTKAEHDGLIEAFAMTDKNHTPHLLPVWITDAELEEEGFEKVDDTKRENGFFAGQNDTPEKDATVLFIKGAEAVAFRHVEQSQFYFKWDVWVKWPEEKEQAA